MTTHYCPRATPGMPVWKRLSLCGVVSRVGYDPERDGTHDEEGRPLGAGSSSPEHVDCPECERLGADAARERARIEDPGLLDHDREPGRNETTEEDHAP